MTAQKFSPPNLLTFDDRRDWRARLKTNLRKEQEAWLVFAKRHTGKRRIGIERAA